MRQGTLDILPPPLHGSEGLCSGPADVHDGGEKESRPGCFWAGMNWRLGSAGSVDQGTHTWLLHCSDFSQPGSRALQGSILREVDPVTAHPDSRSWWTIAKHSGGSVR